MLAKYIKLYKQVHGTTPKGMDIENWSQDELAKGITTLELMIKYL